MSSESNENVSEDINSRKNSGIEMDSNWGYDLYPERKSKYQPTWGQIILGTGGQESINKLKCEKKAYECLKTSKLVQLMTAALKSSGCAIDMRRHISCEVCDPSVTGGYDPLLNQIVLCENLNQSKGVIQGTLVHEMIHMFDYCRHNVDFTNIEHVACTEIRAANLAHCSFLSAWIQGDASPINFKKQHQECVKNKAVASVLAVRNVSEREAVIVVERVFPKCYYDLEPIGRRLKRKLTDLDKAYEEGYYYGYV